eukprot:6634338-Prymnesium_polylepis.1
MWRSSLVMRIVGGASGGGESTGQPLGSCVSLQLPHGMTATGDAVMDGAATDDVKRRMVGRHGSKGNGK